MRSLYQSHDKHWVAVDSIIFGYENEQLKLLLIKRDMEPEKGKWSLVGGWVKSDESAEDAAYRVLTNITGLKDIFMEQVSVFSKPQRDSGGRVISLVFYALIDIKAHNYQLVHKYGAKWWPVTEAPDLIFDHEEMVQQALERLRMKASRDLVGRDLLPEEFTLIELRKLYNSIFLKEFDPGNFRKKILSLNATVRLNKKYNSESKKGAYYYRFKDRKEWDFTDRIINI